MCADLSSSVHGRESLLHGLYSIFGGDIFAEEKAGIMTGQAVFAAGVSETGDDFHSDLSKRFVKSLAEGYMVLDPRHGEKTADLFTGTENDKPSSFALHSGIGVEKKTQP